MEKPPIADHFLPMDIDPAASTPLYRQVYENLRQAILTRTLKAGTRLPPTRLLAERLGVSRSTIILAFEQLYSEGYVEGRAGSGTYVASQLPEDLLKLTTQANPERPVERKQAELSARGKSLA